MRCRRLFRRSVVFTVSMFKLWMARRLVLVKDLKMRTWEQRMIEELARTPRGRSRYKCINCISHAACREFHYYSMSIMCDEALH